MPELTITWTLRKTELALLDQLVAAWNRDAAAAYAAQAADAAAEDPPRDPGPAPVPETRDSFTRRISLKALQGQMVTIREDIRRRNLSLVMTRYDDPTVPQADKEAALTSLGLGFDGLLLVKI